MTREQSRRSRVRVDADLAVEVDEVTARVCAAGDVVRVATDRPLALAAKLSGTSLPRIVEESFRSAGSGLAESGLRVEIHSPRGLVAAVGSTAGPPVAPMRAGRRTTRRHVQPGSAGVVAGEVAHEAGVVVRQRPGVAIVVIVVLAVIIGVGVVRRRHGRG